MRDNDETASELGLLMGDAAGLVLASEGGDSEGVAALLAGLSVDERDGLIVALTMLVGLGWRSAWRAGHQDDGADELAGYLGRLVEHARHSR